MLQAIRNKMHGWPSIILLGVCVLAMSLFGMESYFTASNNAYVAKVGKHDITPGDYQDRMNQLRQKESAEQGDRFDPGIFEKPAIKLQILEQMIDEQLLLQANQAWGMRVADQSVRDTIAGIPAFQLNGQFDPTSYRSWLDSQRKTADAFQDEIKASLAAQILPDAINDSTIITDGQAKDFLSLLTQRRDLQYMVLPTPALADSKVTDAEISAYYQAHQAAYMRPEQVSVKYIEVDAASLPAAGAPTDDELKKRYADEKQRFVLPEQRLISHILINVPPNATPQQQKDALAKAEKIDAEATPADFAKLAEKDSDDLGSKRQGGDLGWLEKGVTNAAFDSAMFSMQKGQISKPVLSPDGYHIIWLRDIRSGDAKPFEQVRAQLIQEWTATAQERQYNELAGKLSDSTYQNPSSLDPASTSLGLPIKTTPMFGRAGGSGVAANPKFIAAAFSDDVLVQGNNSGLIELGKDHAVVLRLDKHVPAAVKPLEEVRADVQKAVLADRVAVIEKQQASAALAKLRGGETLQSLAAAMGAKVVTAAAVVRGQSALPPALITAAFVMPHPVAGKPQFASVDMQDGSYALLAVDKVQGGDLSKVTPEQLQSLRQQMAQAYGFEARREMLQVLRAKTEIKINKSQL